MVLRSLHGFVSHEDYFLLLAMIQGDIAYINIFVLGAN